MTEITIKKLDESDPSALLHWYPQQQRPQDCYIWLDIRDGTMGASDNAEIGNAIPMDVYHGIVRRYPIPLLQAKTVNALMEVIAPYAATVVDHTDIEWDGSNHVAVLDDDALIAEQHIIGDGDDFPLKHGRWSDPDRYHRGILGVLDHEEPDLHVWSAADWFSNAMAELRSEVRVGRSLDTLYEEYQGDGTSEDSPVIHDLMSFLEGVKDEVEDDEPS